MRVPEKESQPIPPTQQLSGSALRKYALYLNQFNQSSLRYIPQICAPNRSLVPKGATPPPGVIAQMAAQLESALLGPIIQMKLMWPAQAGTSTECMRPHCNLCSKGWVGIVTLRQRYIDMGGTPFYTRMDKYYLGGSQPNSTDIPAEWTVSAGGMSSDRRWSLAAPVDYQGQCPAVANQPQVCVRAVTNAGKTQFLEQNSQISLLQRLAVTQLASGYTGLYTLWENSLPSTPPISVPPASPPVPLTTTCPTLTLATAGYSCVGEWTWNLIFQ